MTNYNVTLQVWADNKVVVKSIQGEAGSRALDVSLIGADGVQPVDLTGCTPRMAVSNGTATPPMNDGTIIDAAGGIAEFQITSDMLKVAGEWPCEIILSGPNYQTLKANGLKLHVDASTFEPTLEATNEYSSLIVALNDAKSATQAGADATAAADKAAHVPQYGENGNWQSWDGTAYVDTGKPWKGDKGETGATGLQGPRGDTGATGLQGPKGDKGDMGDGLMIKGVYPTLADLQTAHPTGSAGDAYEVGTEDSNVTYIWDTDKTTWESIGSLAPKKSYQSITELGSVAFQSPLGTTMTESVSAKAGVGLTAQTIVENISAESGVSA